MRRGMQRLVTVERRMAHDTRARRVLATAIGLVAWAVIASLLAIGLTQ